MRKVRSSWWPYLKGVIRDYPVHKIIPEVLSPQEAKEYIAVENALEEIRSGEDPMVKLKVLKLMFWSTPTMNIEKAATAVGCSKEAAAQIKCDFANSVAAHIGLVT